MKTENIGTKAINIWCIFNLCLS